MNYRAVFSAVVQTAGMFVAGFVVPVVGQIIALFTPVPLILLWVRNSRQEGVIALIASSVFIGLVAGWQTAGILFFSFGLMAAGTAEGMRRDWKAESAALLGGLLPVAALVIVSAWYFARIQRDPVAVIEEYLKGTMAEAAKFYTQLGFTEMASVIGSISETVVHKLVLLIPGITIATSVFQAACCYGLSRSIMLRRPGNARISQTSLARWHAPDVWVWGLIIGLALILVPGHSARFAGWNAAIIYAVVYLVQGVAIVDYYLRKARVQPFIRGLIQTLILALPSIVFVIALGIVDIWADFRKVRGPVQTSS